MSLAGEYIIRSWELDDGRKLSMTLNTQSQMLIMDVVNAEGTAGNEFIRVNLNVITVPEAEENDDDR